MRRHHRGGSARAFAVAFMLAMFAVTLGLRVLAAVWPILLLTGVTAAAVVARRRWLARVPTRPNLRVIRGEMVSEDAEHIAQLQTELSRLRGLVARLEDAANRPLEAVIANYERIGRQYGPAAVGKPGDRP